MKERVLSKSRILKFRVTEDEHARLVRRAVAERTTLTNLVRGELGLEGSPSTVTYATAGATARLREAAVPTG
jgi:hypothetical protein